MSAFLRQRSQAKANQTLLLTTAVLQEMNSSVYGTKNNDHFSSPMHHPRASACIPGTAQFAINAINSKQTFNGEQQQHQPAAIMKMKKKRSLVRAGFLLPATYGV